jgi:hypothetical protein
MPILCIDRSEALVDVVAKKPVKYDAKPISVIGRSLY